MHTESTQMFVATLLILAKDRNNSNGRRFPMGAVTNHHTCWFETTNAISFHSGGPRSGAGLSSQCAGRARFSGACRAESVSLPFLASRGRPHLLAGGPFLRLQSRRCSISKSLSPESPSAGSSHHILAERGRTKTPSFEGGCCFPRALWIMQVISSSQDS